MRLWRFEAVCTSVCQSGVLYTVYEEYTWWQIVILRIISEKDTSKKVRYMRPFSCPNSSRKESDWNDKYKKCPKILKYTRWDMKKLQTAYHKIMSDLQDTRTVLRLFETAFMFLCWYFNSTNASPFESKHVQFQVKTGHQILPAKTCFQFLVCKMLHI